MSPQRFRVVMVIATCIFSGNGRSSGADPDTAKLRKAVTFYASFDEKIQGDVGGGKLAPSTRYDHPEKKGQYLIEPGYPKKAFRIVKGGGVHGGALEGVDVLPRRGRLFFPMKGNLAFNPKGWSGSASVWINTNPNTQLKTSFCDPIQITEKGAHNGGIWMDFPNVKPRDFRMGIFRGLGANEKAVPESDPKAPLVRIKKIDFKTGDWRHVVITWKNFDTGKANAEAILYVDGKQIGKLSDRQMAMKWNVDRAGIYFAVSYIGLLDELALFNRALTPEEINYLQKHPEALSRLKPKSN